MNNTTGPKPQFRAWIAQLLRSYPTLSLPQLQIWLEETYLTWRDRELGPETYDPLADLGTDLGADLSPLANQDQPQLQCDPYKPPGNPG